MDALAEIPTFRPTSGCDFLAAADSAGNADDTAGHSTGAAHLNKPGPFNPVATLAPKVAKKVLELEFVDMSEVTMDTPPESTPCRPVPPCRPMVTDISH